METKDDVGFFRRYFYGYRWNETFGWLLLAAGVVLVERTYHDLSLRGGEVSLQDILATAKGAIPPTVAALIWQFKAWNRIPIEEGALLERLVCRNPEAALREVQADPVAGALLSAIGRKVTSGDAPVAQVPVAPEASGIHGLTPEGYREVPVTELQKIAVPRPEPVGPLDGPPVFPVKGGGK